ncbi:methylated-DNA--[protein]-cysteine S-methyltransferase [Aquirufa aurantiipilula]|uniref:methylated-DNA--[protein]-cysteine S-methyltransferase n=1 Tax=Aquirufa aurantiipilula TaxID=2696561 RepID=UPI001CAA4BF1|nr:methylated-DNA--[protein]-cysteine S-methyltransferase [Aquirufa aurantiipilula]MBZ1325204.1 methylated-DNA--[protein]-cysteine S-methyltransferase [Aquirufa aurantiipilula]
MFFYHSPIGFLQIGLSDKGLTSLQFVEQGGNDVIPDKLKRMQEEVVRNLDAYFEKPNWKWTCPVDFSSATTFQKKVWSALLEIPVGEVMSYQQIAELIEQPKAAQAVGNANAQNPVLLLVPCHRVIGSDGSLVGYRGELWRKEWLLKHEGYPGLIQQLNLF